MSDSSDNEATEAWSTPFSNADFPSCWLINEPRGDNTCAVVVAPRGLDEYPKFIVWFSGVYAVSSEEEADSPNLYGAQHAPEGACAYRWLRSPLVAAYSRLYPDFRFCGGSQSLQHYVFLGGDSMVTVVAGDEPEIEEVAAPRTLNVLHTI